MRQLLCFCLLISSSILSFSQKVTGLVTDADGIPIPFASVFVKGTLLGTNANSEGQYFLELEPGKYTIVCQHVNYRQEERDVTLVLRDVEINFALSVQETVMDTVVIRGGPRVEPALEIIRNTIDKRSFHANLFSKFETEVYTKGQLKIRSYSKSLLGPKLSFEEGDTSKMLYLSETISKYSVNKPNKEKVTILSSRVSGQSDGYGLSAPQFLSLYDNNIFIGNNLNPRGFISPISDNAFHYYDYKYEGSFFEDGREISKILVIPKRKYEPLFSGYINIVENEWLIHSVQLLLTKVAQMQFVDSLIIEQLYRPISADRWAIHSQIVYPSAKVFGIDAFGSFINIYSNFNFYPQFEKDYFNNTIIKYTDSANRKTTEYWETVRPIPLKDDEIADYIRKDSLEIVRSDPRYIDSLEKVRNRVNLFGALLFEQTLFTASKRTTFTYRPLTEQFSFNVAEGFVINTGAVWTKVLDTTKIMRGRRSISFAPNLRYGFTNKHFNAHLTFMYTYGKKNSSSIAVSGGKRIFQFNNNSPIGPRGNTLSSLLGENNRMKIYEAWYFRGSYNKGIGNGISWTFAFQYQDRMPLDNKTDYTWRDRKDVEYTPNFPNELVSENIKRHQVFYTLLGFSWQPGTRYMEMPDQRINLGSKYPVFSLQYIRNFNSFLGSDADFSKWKFQIRDDLNLKLLGKFSYRLGVGGFLDNDEVPIPDYQHFNGNLSTFATEFLNSFQLLPLYRFSNTAHFYSLAHLEHNFHGFLTNKIPGIKKLNIFLVVGGNGFYIDKNTNYYELFAGIDNIFKQFRIDFVHGFLDGRTYKSAFRIGFRRSLRPRGDDWP